MEREGNRRIGGMDEGPLAGGPDAAARQSGSTEPTILPGQNAVSTVGVSPGPTPGPVGISGHMWNKPLLAPPPVAEGRPVRAVRPLAPPSSGPASMAGLSSAPRGRSMQAFRTPQFSSAERFTTVGEGGGMPIVGGASMPTLNVGGASEDPELLRRAILAGTGNS